MGDQDLTREQLLEEMQVLRVRVAELGQTNREHERAVEAHQASEELNRRVLEGLPCGLVQVTADGAIVEANENAQRLLGLSRDQLTRRYVSDFREETLWEDGSPCFPQDYPVSKCLASGQPQQPVVIGTRRPDGQVSWALYSAVPLLARGRQQPVGAVVMFVDFTERKRIEAERKQAEEERRREREVLQTLFDHIPVMVTLVDRSGRYLRTNPAWQRTLGWSAEEARSRDVLAEIYPDPDYRRRVLAYVANPTPGWTDFRSRTRDGRILNTSWANVLLADGTCLGIGRDVTAQRQAEEALRASEERYRRIVETAAEGIWMVDANWQTTFVNRPLEQMLGYRAEEFLGRHVLDFLDDEGQRILAEQLRLREEGQSEVYELRLRRKDGKTLWAVLSTSPIIEEGQFTGALAMVSDITERKKTEEQVRDYTERLQTLSRRLVEAQEEERRHVARELHDEIGQVLTAVAISLHNLKGICPEEATAQVEEGIAIVDRAIQQVRNLSLDLRPAMLDDLGLVAALRWCAERQGERAGCTIHFVARSSGTLLPPELKNTCFRVAQEALTNVLRHAGARNVWLELQETDEELRLSVRDDGAGFDLQAARQRASTGGAFGLLSMQERVELLGGRITIDTSPGRGTTIHVRFPLSPELPLPVNDL
jgi:PAS domain S-box-containing protein